MLGQGLGYDWVRAWVNLGLGLGLGSGFGFWVLGFGFWVLGLGFGFWVLVAGSGSGTLSHDLILIFELACLPSNPSRNSNPNPNPDTTIKGIVHWSFVTLCPSWFTESFNPLIIKTRQDKTRLE